MAVTVTYNGASPWGTYSPYVSMNITPMYFGTLWCQVREITLEGFHPGSNLETTKDSIINAFADNNKVFSFTGAGGSFTAQNTFVDSINFPQQRMHGVLQYSILLKSYDFGSNPEILDPSDQIITEDTENLTTTVTHTVSAAGIFSGSAGAGGPSAMSNAISWAQSRIALAPTTQTILQTYGYIIAEETEEVNQFTNRFTVTRKYLVDKLNSSNAGAEPVMRFSVSVNSQLHQDFDKVTVMGEIRGGKTDTLTSLRAKAAAEMKESDMRTKAISSLSAAVKIDPEQSSPSSDWTGVGIDPPNLQCSDYSVDEEAAGKAIKVKATFTNGLNGVDGSLAGGGSSLYFLDYQISTDTDFITGVSKVSIDAEVITKGGLNERNAQIDNFLQSEDVKELLLEKARKGHLDIISPVDTDGGMWSIGSSFLLNPEPSDLQIVRNSAKGTLKISASFNDEGYQEKYSTTNWEVTVKTPVPLVKANPSGLSGTNGFWSMQSFDFCTRERIGVNYSATLKENMNIAEADKEAELRSKKTAKVGALYSAYAGNGGCAGSECYKISESTNLNNAGASSISHSEERSVHRGRPPLIDINLVEQLTNPTCPSSLQEGLCESN